MELLLPHIDYNRTISEIVQSDYRTADVFKKYGIDYCCGDGVLLEEICASQNISFEAVQEELIKATRTLSLSNTLQFDHWRLDFLLDYIINIHHCYLKQVLPSLEMNLASFVNSHKKQYAEPGNLLRAFRELSCLLLTHIQHEEEALFPYIRQVENMHRRQEVYASLFIKTMRKSLTTVVDKEHKQIRDLLVQLRSQTGNYQFSHDACISHQVIYHKLRELDNDLMQHTHLELNILYPKAMQMEQELLHHSNIH